MSTKTIFALATAPAKSGVAIIRLSGSQAKHALSQLTKQTEWTPNAARYVTFRNVSDNVIDRGLALFFKGPASFTGEDVAELHIHGSLAVIREMLDTLSQIEGLTPAEPGEFSRRAFLNDKMDLIEAEGLADLIDAETPIQKTQALRQMEGELSAYYDELRTHVLTVMAHLEAYIDFPDEEIPESVIEGLGADIANLKKTIESALGDHRRGEKVREGIHVVILGAPNAGKSSLLNALSKREAAIVSQHAGTTRDVIEVHMSIAGLPVILIDTAGIRESTDEIEEEGVRRALAKAQNADLKLVVLDGSKQDVDKQSLSLIDDQTITLFNKSDIQISENLICSIKNLKFISISTKTGEGISDLLKEIEGRVGSLYSNQTPFITRARHRAALTEALAILNRLKLDAPLEITCEELRKAAHILGKITGKIAVDELLGVIFSTFCIGK